MPRSAGPGPGSARCLRHQCSGFCSTLHRHLIEACATLARRRYHCIGFPRYFIIEEYLRVLSYPKFKLSEGDIKGLVQEELLPYVEVVKAGRRLRVVDRDPSDDKFVEVAGKARVIISGDKDLLSIGRYQKILIQSPAQFLEKNPQLR
jgi:hypothetical protein